MLNITAHGNLGQDPELKDVGQSQVANFSLAAKTGKDETTWINCQVWGKTGQTILDRCKLMDSIMVTGNIKRQEWQDKETGAKRSKHVLSVARFEFLPRNTSDAQPAAASSDEEVPF